MANWKKGVVLEMENDSILLNKSNVYTFPNETLKIILRGKKFIKLLFLVKLGSALFCMCDALRDLVSFVQFKKREKHPTPPWMFFTFFKLY